MTMTLPNYNIEQDRPILLSKEETLLLIQSLHTQPSSNVEPLLWRLVELYNDMRFTPSPSYQAVVEAAL